jgi:hypothetical protein
MYFEIISRRGRPLSFFVFKNIEGATELMRRCWVPPSTRVMMILRVGQVSCQRRNRTGSLKYPEEIKSNS